MRDHEIARLAGRQFNRVSREQLLERGVSRRAIEHRLATGRLVLGEQGVFGIAPILEDDEWGTWMEATLTASGTRLSHQCSGSAWGFWTLPCGLVTVTRPGCGGPRRHGGLLVYRSQTLDGDCTELRDVPITTVPRTLLDLAAHISDRALARCVRDAVRLELITIDALADRLGRSRGRRGVRRLAATIARYRGLPLEKARSGAEIRAMELLRDAGRPLPRLNARIGGEEADLSWPGWRLIIEIDGGPFHLDVGEDARKQAVWEARGWTVRRVSSDDVYERPARLLEAAHPPQ